ALVSCFVFRLTLDKFGLSNNKQVSTGGAMIASNAFRFLSTIGVNLTQNYWSVEAGYATDSLEENGNGNSVGTIRPEVEASISEQGELLLRRGGLFRCYFKDTAATEQAIDGDGWYHTGDACYIDDKRRLYFISRLSDMRQLAIGEKYAPEHIESNIRFGTYVRDCLAIGDETRDYVSAIVYLDFQSIARWADMGGLLYSTLVELSQSDEVAELVLDDIMRVNSSLPEYARIGKYVVSHREYEADVGATGAGKLRREQAEHEYADLINGIYAGSPVHTIQATVAYSDGRMAVVPTDIKIRSVEAT
ncbi:hypothetical protein ACFLX5_06160, partial [Chloroflexota bacterium]